MRLDPVSLRPRERLHDRPPACALTIELELVAETVEPMEDIPPRVAELAGADDRRDRELALRSERLRVDDEPRLPLRAHDVVAVHVLMHEHELALRRGEVAREPCDARIEIALDPPLDLVPERVEAVGA